MHALNLTAWGKPFFIFVPDTLKTPYHITEKNTAALEITSGPNFAIVINEQFSDLAQIRSDLKNDDVNKLTSFITNEPSAIFWESAITRPEFHLCLNKKIKNAEYSFEDRRSSEVEPFQKEGVQKMLDACQRTAAEK